MAGFREHHMARECFRAPLGSVRVPSNALVPSKSLAFADPSAHADAHLPPGPSDAPAHRCVPSGLGPKPRGELPVYFHRLPYPQPALGTPPLAPLRGLPVFRPFFSPTFPMGRSLQRLQMAKTPPISLALPTCCLSLDIWRSCQGAASWARCVPGPTRRDWRLGSCETAVDSAALACTAGRPSWRASELACRVLAARDHQSRVPPSSVHFSVGGLEGCSVLDPEHGDRDHEAQYDPKHYLHCLLLPLWQLFDPLKRHRSALRTSPTLRPLATSIANAHTHTHDSRASNLFRKN
jgi:hypothetical protein